MSIKSVKYIVDPTTPSSEKTGVKITYNNDKIWSAPINENNRHYQEVLEWVAAGNTIEEAD